MVESFKQCECCGRVVTNHNGWIVSSIQLCADCREVMKENSEKTASERERMLKESKQALVKELKARGIENPEQWLENEKKRIQRKGESLNG